ncbi:hypothetical protein Tco_0478828 [Tanacetum coccineum]
MSMISASLNTAGHPFAETAQIQDASFLNAVVKFMLAPLSLSLPPWYINSQSDQQLNIQNHDNDTSTCKPQDVQKGRTVVSLCSCSLEYVQ